MGASLALAALDAARRVGLSHAPARLLVRFALAAVDRDAAPWSRLSMEERCAALGHESNEAGRRAVERATSAIVAAGLASLVAGGNRSGAARYALHLTPVDTSESPPLSVEQSEVKAPRLASESPPLSVRKPPAKRGAKEDGGETEEETRASAPALHCPKHPHGNSSTPCRGCAEAREARAAQPTVSAMNTVQPGPKGWCAPGKHRRIEDGSCIHCDHRLYADDPSAEPPRSPWPTREEVTTDAER